MSKVSSDDFIKKTLEFLQTTTNEYNDLEFEWRWKYVKSINFDKLQNHFKLVADNSFYETIAIQKNSRYRLRVFETPCKTYQGVVKTCLFRYEDDGFSFFVNREIKKNSGFIEQIIRSNPNQRQNFIQRKFCVNKFGDPWCSFEISKSAPVLMNKNSNNDDDIVQSFKDQRQNKMFHSVELEHLQWKQKDDISSQELVKVYEFVKKVHKNVFLQ